MNYLIGLSGILLLTLFFFNIKKAVDILCRIIGGAFFLIFYNNLVPFIPLPLLGVNLISSTVCGVLGVGGWILLICCRLFL